MAEPIERATRRALIKISRLPDLTTAPVPCTSLLRRQRTDALRRRWATHRELGEAAQAPGITDAVLHDVRAGVAHRPVGVIRLRSSSLLEPANRPMCELVHHLGADAAACGLGGVALEPAEEPLLSSCGCRHV